jgi:hypothetical protein
VILKILLQIQATLTDFITWGSSLTAFEDLLLISSSFWLIHCLGQFLFAILKICCIYKQTWLKHCLRQSSDWFWRSSAADSSRLDWHTALGSLFVIWRFLCRFKQIWQIHCQLGRSHSYSIL